MSEDLALSENTNPVIIKAQQHLIYLQKLEQANLLQKLLVNCYYCAIQSVLTYSMSVWINRCTKTGQQALQRLIKSAGEIVGAPLPDITTVNLPLPVSTPTASSRAISTQFITCSPPSSGKGFRFIQAQSTRINNNFFIFSLV